MSKSTLNPTKKKMGRPPVDSEQVNIRIERSVINAIDVFTSEQSDSPTRPEAIRRLLTDKLIGLGLLDETTK